MDEAEGNGSEESISMGPADLLSCDEASGEPVHSVVSDLSLLSPPSNRKIHAMGNLSISSITTSDCSQVVQQHAFSPDAEFRPDILMSTVNSKQMSTSQEDLSISFGPLPGFDMIHGSQEHNLESHLCEDPITSLAVKIQNYEIKQKLPSHNYLKANSEAKSVQTEDFNCPKCEDLHIHYNQKLLEVANEFQHQYASQFHMAEQHALASEDAQKQIKDLMDQLDGADKQLKANRLFLEQQAVEREQEREEANANQKKLEGLLTEREKEYERISTSAQQLSCDLQHLQEVLKEKERVIQEHVSTQQHLEEQNQVLRRNQNEMNEDNSNLQAILEVKDKLLKAQSGQIAALQEELENHIYATSETDRGSDAPGSRNHNSTLQDVADISVPVIVTSEMPTLFDELQQLIVRLLHKVDNSTRALEAAQMTTQTRTNSSLLSPRNLVTPSTSTEDISIKDRHDGVLNSRKIPTADDGQNEPERALNFLQQLDGKLAILNRIEEAACKRIADLEAELQRVAQSEKRSISRADELERQYKQHQLLLQDVDAEKHELQVEHTELLKRISSLENRLEEQRRSAALGASQNLHAEKCRSLSEEKQQLQLAVQEKEELLASMQKQVNDLHQRIEKLMKTIQEKEQESTKRSHDDFSQSSVERLRDAPPQDGSMTWSKLHGHTSPVPLSPIYQPKQYHHQQLKHSEMSHLVHIELDELRAKLAKSEKERQILEDEAACNVSRLTQLEALERRNAALDHILDEAEQQKNDYQERNKHLEEELEICIDKLRELELVQARNAALEKELDELKLIGNEFDATRQSYETLKKEFLSEKQTNQTAIDILQKKCIQMETDLAEHQNLLKVYDNLRRRCKELETETIAQRGTVTAVEVLQQRCNALQADIVYNKKSFQQQSTEFKAQLDSKERQISELKGKLKFSDSCKIQVEEALHKLQLEVEAIKQAQHLQKIQMNSRTVDPRELSTVLEGPTAPPDLLAPSFIEFLGSTTSSRCSSRTASNRGSPAHRTAESSAFHDLSLPNSMVGKTTLKKVQRESEQLLAFGKQLLELQQNTQQQKENFPPTNPNQEDDLETTLKPDGKSFEIVASQVEEELVKKIQLLETELAMEKLLLQDQQASNTRLQQQVMQLIAQQRSINQVANNQAPSKTVSAYRSLQPESAAKILQYRALKLESIRKNLIYQKKFLTGIALEWDQNHNHQIKERWNKKKPLRRFKVIVLAVISIQRMRFVAKQWRQRRRAIETRPSSEC